VFVWQALDGLGVAVVVHVNSPLDSKEM